jgi:TRAP-type C4-dicarboxylate transport system permease small subunit
VSGFLAWHGLRFVRDSAEFGEMAFESVPLWLTATVLPIAFGLLSLRFLMLAVFHLLRSFDEGAAG